MSVSLNDYLDPGRAPAEKPALKLFSAATAELHRALDKAMRRQGVPYLHPEEPTLQLDMLGSRHMEDWQQRKVEWVMASERCWSDLHQFYARYGVETTRALLAKVRQLENSTGAVLTDCGMQAVALTFDVLARPNGHAVLARGVYNKSRRYLEWLGDRLGLELTLVDDNDYQGIEAALRKETFVVFVETYTNPLLRAIDPQKLGALVKKARQKQSKYVTLVVDNTIATPWGVNSPLLDFDGIDVIVASGTKALAGQDTDLWGYVASNRVDLLNEVMDLEAMRGGGLDWRRARVILEGLDVARRRFEERCASATRIAAFLGQHPQIEHVHHPSLAGHEDRATVEKFYSFPGSLLSFRIRDADEEAARHFADVLATCVVPRYAGSFDGLSTKINHHRTVSEYFTPAEEIEKAGIDRVLRLGVGLESPDDIIACLNWALWRFKETSKKDVLAWQKGREIDLGIRGERS